MPEVTFSEWKQFLQRHPEAHILQTSAWGELKKSFGWQVKRLLHQDAGAQILIKQLLPGIQMAYIPKGPIGSDWVSLIPEIDRICRKQHCVFLKIEPDAWEQDSSPQPDLPAGFNQNPQSIQPSRTLIVDLRGGDQVLLGRMKQKTRYNINLARKKGVIIKPTTDLQIFHRLIEMTAQRDRFGVHQQDYYQRAYQLFYPGGQCELLLAEYEHNPLGALMVFAYGKRAWYFYGGSSDTHRDRMPNYLLQWEAMQWARAQGCTEYDLWGVPDYDLDTLETEFTQRNNGLWGVYRFKRGFGGTLRRSIGSWDRVYMPLLYRFYQVWQNTRKVE